MDKLDANILMITAGGVGRRVGSSTPKQYLPLNGKPVISYVIHAGKNCKAVDSIVVVADPIYHDDLKNLYGVDVACSGETLNESKRNGLDYIKNNSSCKKLIIADAVRPTVNQFVFETMFQLLDQFDAVACARKITDSLGRYGEWIVKRDEYYTLNAPEGFRFGLLEKHFRSDSDLTESIQQLPRDSKIHLLFDVPYFYKVTYSEDLEFLGSYMRMKE